MREDSGAKRGRIYQQVLEHLRAYIVENRLVPGDRLPAETSLAQSLGVSRHSVREAVKILESMGVVASNTRDGTRLQAAGIKPAAGLLRFLLDVERVPLSEIAAARRITECSMMATIVSNATPDDFAHIEAAVAAMERAEAAADFLLVNEADAQFHQALMAATNNRAIESFGVMLQEFFLYLRYRSSDEKLRGFENAGKEHRAIYEALRAGDAERASALMHAHLQVYSSELFTGA